jgi:hypothetical protein
MEKDWKKREEHLTRSRPFKQLSKLLNVPTSTSAASTEAPVDVR